MHKIISRLAREQTTCNAIRVYYVGQFVDFILACLLSAALLSNPSKRHEKVILVSEMRHLNRWEQIIKVFKSSQFENLPERN